MEPRRENPEASWVSMAAAGLLLAVGGMSLSGDRRIAARDAVPETPPSTTVAASPAPPPAGPRPDPRTLANQAVQYEAHRPKPPLELQRFHRTFTAHVHGPSGTDGTAVLRIRAREAGGVCEALGKRLCDAHDPESHANDHLGFRCCRSLARP